MLSIVIPTLDRGETLLETIDLLGQCRQPTNDLIIVDQTSSHPERIAEALDGLHGTSVINWLRLSAPSIPHAMNVGLCAARNPIVLFLDDDIIPDADLLVEHLAAHDRGCNIAAVVGQILQPDEQSTSCSEYVSVKGFCRDLQFPFYSDQTAVVHNVMAGNLSVDRNKALSAGGFDENFVGVAYRFETEFARRLIRAGGVVVFEPAASIRHLRLARGGTRARGSHLTSASPQHGVGDYYFALRAGVGLSTLAYIGWRPIREVSTRFHLRRPWYIPVKLLGESLAFVNAVVRCVRGPQLLDTSLYGAVGAGQDESPCA